QPSPGRTPAARGRVFEWRTDAFRAVPGDRFHRRRLAVARPRTGRRRGPRAGGRAVKRRRQRGFTLLEVMVAMAIVSIGLIAVFNAIIQMAHSTSTLRERALADWIAMNQISEIRL